MKNLILTDDEYRIVMQALKQALIDEDGGPNHENLSVTYHTLGAQHGYTEDGTTAAGIAGDGDEDDLVLTKHQWCDECQRDTRHTRFQLLTDAVTYIWLCAEHR